MMVARIASGMYSPFLSPRWVLATSIEPAGPRDRSKRRTTEATTPAISNPNKALRIASTTSIQPDGFRVSAKNAVGQGPTSTEVSATPEGKPDAPLGLSAAVAPAIAVGSGDVRRRVWGN